jgi:hypothetical protein
MASHQPLEELKQLLNDRSLHIEYGVIQQLEASPTRKTLRALVALQPDGHQMVAKVCWDNIDDEAGVIMFPAIGDLVVVGFASGDEDDARILTSCSSIEERIPLDALDGSLVLKARKGKPTRVLSDTKVLIQKAKFGANPNPDATEPLVLGNVLVNLEQDLINAFINAPQIGQCAVGPVFLDPGLASTLTMLISKYLTTATTNILSQIGFTERGT